MYRVLIADDEPIERTVVCKTIQKYFPNQLEVIQAVNGREAVELFEKHRCHIALLDIEMPGVNGLEAAKKIREKNRKCSIIFLTAFDDFSYAKRAISVHALDYLLKPGADEELIAVLEEAIRIEEEIERTEELQEVKQEEKRLSEKAVQQEEERAAEGIRLNAVSESILEYIKNHYKEDISLQDVAEAMNYSDAYFCKLFKQCFDKSFTVYLSEFRVEKAKQLLADVMINIKDISYEVGYRDSNYFARVFKRIAGVTPSDYRIQVLQNGEKPGMTK